MANQMGFQWQGDVFAGTTLIFEAAGRILKQLSDSGIDTYALGGIIQLGTLLPISPHQEHLVSAAMEKRGRTKAGWLAKALSLGWGPSDAIYEISRTRGGCAALLTVTAFAAGSNTLVAAQGIQELMRLHGCEDSSLPAVDALRNTIAALTPILEDTGFNAILTTVHVAAVSELGRILPGMDFLHEERCLIQDIGTPEEWTSIAYQLCMTARSRQSVYIHTVSRAAWLTAFAVRNLEMDCTVVYHNQVLWSAPGVNGRVTIQVAHEPPNPPSGFFSCLTLNPEPEIMQTIQELELTYTLAEALNSELDMIPNLPWASRQNVKTAIVDLFTFLSTRECFTPSQDKSESATRVLGHFSITSARIVSVCRDLGLELDDIENTVRHIINSANRGFLLQPSRGREFEMLPSFVHAELKQNCYCDIHQGRGKHYGHLCTLSKISDIISGFATTALALLPCQLEIEKVRVCARSINGSSHANSSWRDGCIKSLTESSSKVDMHELLNHLRYLFHGEEATQLTKDAVAASGRAVSFAVRALFEDEGFNDLGQYLGVYSGRISYDNCFRDVVEESGRWVGGGQSHQLVMPATLAPGIQFLPPSSEFFNPLQVSCRVKTKPDHLEIHCDLVISDDNATQSLLASYAAEDSDDSYLGTTNGRKILFSLTLLDSLSTLLSAFVGRRCNHPRNSALLIPPPDIFNSMEAGIFCSNPSDNACALVSSHGCSSYQLLSMCSVQGAFCSFQARTPKVCLVLQSLSCLACAFQQAEEEYQAHAEYYGSAAVICTGVSSNQRVSAHSVIRTRRSKRRTDIIGKFRMDRRQAIDLSKQMHS